LRVRSSTLEPLRTWTRIFLTII